MANTVQLSGATSLPWTDEELQLYSKNCEGKMNLLKREDLFTSISLALFSLILSIYVMEGWHVDLSAPFSYNSDGLLNSWIIKRLIDGTWYLSSGYSGFPFGSDFYDFPISDTGNLLILKALGIIFGDYAHALNLYFLLGFPVTAIVSYFVIRSFSASRALSIAGAIVFTFIPFHFLRLGHLFYTWYFVVPLFAWYSLRISAGAPLFFSSSETRNSKAVTALILIGMSSFGVYYAFFGVVMFFAAGCIGSLQQKSKKHIFSALIATSIVTVGVVANIAPNYIYRFEHGTNPEVAQRAPAHSEILGLKVTQLLLPRPGHRSEKFAEVTRKYSGHFPLVNENSFAALGMIGSIGFMLMLGVLLSNGAQKPESHNSFVLNTLARITLLLVLTATIGGFSSIFSMLITPEMRAWNRISIFIGFTAIATFVLIADNCIKKIRPPQYMLPIKLSTIAVLVLFAIWDQTPPACNECRATTKLEFKNDDDFVKQIEAIVPKSSGIYQLPYFPFPETPPLHNLTEYSHFRGYLHSTDLKWSYGGMKGREGDLYFRELAEQPLAKQLDVIERLNFGGIYIDRRGYEDHGKAIENEFSTLLDGAQPIVSADKQLVFFPIPAKYSANILPEGLSPAQIMERANFVVEHCMLPECLKLSINENSGIPHQVGILRSNKIITDGRPGFIAFGPQVTMSSGKYLLQIYGTAQNIDGAKIDVISDGGVNILANFEHISSPVSSEILLEKEIQLNEQSKQLEVRIFVNTKTVLDLSGYKLRRIGD